MAKLSMKVQQRRGQRLPQGPDSRVWHVDIVAVPCKECGCVPIAARTGQRGIGWHLQCPKNYEHGAMFEQWLPKARRRWDAIHGSANTSN